MAHRGYRVLGLEPGQVPACFAALRAWWLAHGFRVLDERPAGEFLWVENNTDAFQMTLKANPAGGVFLHVGSPCAWPDGTAP